MHFDPRMAPAQVWGVRGGARGEAARRFKKETSQHVLGLLHSFVQFLSTQLACLHEVSVLKLEGGTELFWVLGWGESEFVRHADGGKIPILTPLYVLLWGEPKFSAYLRRREQKI